MSDHSLVHQSELDLTLLHRGKVRDMYEVDADTLLMVASDRVSAFDVVLPQPVPHKGEVLTLMTAWWLEQLDDLLPHHLIAVDPDRIIDRYPQLAASRDVWGRRAMLVRRTEPVLVECVVRGYISGSAWKEYEHSGTLAGEALPEGLRESQRLEPAIFSPATKAQAGDHDENISFGQAREILGAELADRLRDLSLRIYAHGRDVAEESDIILADTKFEFGFDAAAFQRIKENLMGEADADAYGVLGLSRDADDGEIKSTYRKLIREHHPDTLIAKGLPQEFIDVATAKMAAINAAYDRIEAERGLK
ncbi:MAG: phosphoribosylaminoimidazolesuccinocarboxamide synthase [Gemmatimonadetes bacterium]|nr:phosphoribosylaminoimidazolesuccinocarboxamide synthase [Gemmatimonadota bacterium]